MSFQKSRKNIEKKSKQIQAISANIDRLDDKQMNENNAGSNADWNKFKIQGYRFRKIGKQKTKLFISAPITSASLYLLY